VVRIIVALVALVALPRTVVGQEPRVAVGGTFNLVAQTRADDQPLGGTTFGGSALFGVRVASNVAIEFEPSFGGSYSWQYTYRPAPSLTATVIPSRRDTFLPVQARTRMSVLEPVAGVAIVRSTIGRHATVGDTTYFDDSRSENALALVGGLDVACKVAAHVYLVPTFRVFIGPRGSSGDPLGEQTSTGAFTFRYGVGMRAGF
jgi:hypothetical protein